MRLYHWISLVSLSFLWGASFYFTEKALLYFSFEQITFLRIVIADFFIFCVLLIKKIPLRFSIKLLGIFILLGLFNNVIPFLGFTYAQESITASLASLCNATTPIFTVILAHFFTKDEKLTFKTALGILLGFIGMVILFNPSNTLSFEYGTFIALFSAFSFAVAGIFGKLLKGYDPLLSSFGMLSASSLILLLIFPTEIISIEFTSWIVWQDILFLAIFSTAIAYMIYFRLLFTIGAVKLLSVTYLVPISGILLGVWLLGETISYTMMIGAVFIFISLWIVNHERTV